MKSIEELPNTTDRQKKRKQKFIIARHPKRRTNVKMQSSIPNPYIICLQLYADTLLFHGIGADAPTFWAAAKVFQHSQVSILHLFLRAK